MARIHDLKIAVDHLIGLMAGDKKAEIRLNDRNYQKDDVLRFSVFDVQIDFLVTHVLKFPDGLKDDYVCLSVKYIPSKYA